MGFTKKSHNVLLLYSAKQTNKHLIHKFVNTRKKAYTFVVVNKQTTKANNIKSLNNIFQTRTRHPSFTTPPKSNKNPTFFTSGATTTKKFPQRIFTKRSGMPLGFYLYIYLFLISNKTYYNSLSKLYPSPFPPLISYR